MSHTSIAHTRDYLHAADKGDLVNSHQSAGFTVDPLLTPVTTSSLPHPMTSSEPSLDPSTHHPNTHYDPEKKLSRKKRAKKFGVGSAPAHPHSSHVGGRSFAEHDKQQHENAERRDHALAQHAHEAADDEEGEEYSDDDVDDAQEAVSHNSHHENRITGSEQQRGGTAPAAAKPNPTQGQKPAGVSGKGEGEGEKDGEKEGEKEGGEDAAKPGMMAKAQEKATELLSSAQEKASGVMESVKQQPLVNSLLSKVGLAGSSKTDDSTKEDNAQAKKEDEVEA